MPKLSAGQVRAAVASRQSLAGVDVFGLLSARPSPTGQALVCCPAHEDDAPSLSIRESAERPDGVLVNCFAGCDGSAVLFAVRRLAADAGLAAEYRRRASAMNRARFVECTPPERYPYSDGVYKAVGRWVDDEGRPLKERAKKMMRDGHGHSARVEEWFVPAGLAYGPALRIVAGESDAVSLTAAGFPAVSVPNGDHSETPEPVWPAGTRLIVLGDNDTSGQRWAARVATELGAELGRVPVEFNDARGAIEAGRTDVDSWSGITDPSEALAADLSWLLSGGRPETPRPDVLQRPDGLGLFYRSAVNGIFGDPETGKSWVALAACAGEIEAGGSAWYVDIDHNGVDSVVGRLVRYGVRADALADRGRFRYFQPDDADHLRAVSSAAPGRKPGVLVLDSVGELLPMMGSASKDNDEITSAMREIAQPAADAGWCVITIDHLPKAHEARNNGFAIGGMAKKRAIRGSYLHASVPSASIPAPGKVGRITLAIAKDTHGALREAAEGKTIAVFVLDSPAGDGRILWHLEAPRSAEDHADSIAREMKRRVASFVESWAEAKRPSRNQIEKGVTGRNDAIRAAIDALAREGFVEASMDGQANRYRSLKPYPGTLGRHLERHEAAAG